MLEAAFTDGGDGVVGVGISAAAAVGVFGLPVRSWIHNHARDIALSFLRTPLAKRRET